MGYYDVRAIWRRYHKPAAPTPIQRGHDYRLAALQRGCLGGVALNTQGGVGFNRHLRRLVNDGLMMMDRPPVFYGGWTGRLRTTSYLVTTEAGREYLRSCGVTPPERKVTPVTEEDHSRQLRIVEQRRVLVNGERVLVARLAQRSVDPPISDGASLVALDFKDGALVYRCNVGGYVSITDVEALIYAGRLRKTGRGLVLDRYRTYQLHRTPLVEGNLNELMSICPGLILQKFAGPSHYAHARTDQEEVVIRMLFEDDAEKLV